MYDSEMVELALLGLSEGMTPAEVARDLGISGTTVRDWGHGLLPRSLTGKPLESGLRTAAGRAEAGMGCSSGKPGKPGKRGREQRAGAAAEERARMGAAERAAALEGMSADELREMVLGLEMDVAILEQTVDILKKDPGADPAALSSAEKAAVAGALRGRFGLRPLLGRLGLARSTFFYQRAAAGRRDPYEALRPLVRDIFLASGGAYGSARVHAALAAGAGEPQRARGAASLDPSRPVVVSEKVVREIMREEGLVAASSASRARRYSSYEGEEGMAGAPNLLLLDASRDLHEFRAPAPGLVFATDITEFRLPGEARKLYLSPLVDLYDGRVAAWAASDSPNKALVRAMLLRGAAAFAGATAIVHSDRGWHYRTPEWVAMCAELGVVRSLSRKAHSPDNAACEGLFGRMKVEMFRGRDWSGATWADLEAEVGRYIDWYNSGRLKMFPGEGYDTIEGRRARLGLAA